MSVRQKWHKKASRDHIVLDHPFCERNSILLLKFFQKSFLIQSWKCNIIRQILTYIIMHNADINLWVYPNVTSKPNIWTNVSKTMLAAMTSNYITKIHWLALYNFFNELHFHSCKSVHQSCDQANLYANIVKNTWKG